ncbi:MAG: hypothetical protein ACRDPF_07215 [Streptosporangiaceae bacterium]
MPDLRAGRAAGWPSSQPEAGRGNATAVYTGADPAVKVRAAWAWLDWAWLDWAWLDWAGAAAEQEAASRPHAAIASAGINRECRSMGHLRVIRPRAPRVHCCRRRPAR